MRRVVGAAVTTVVIVGLLFLFVLPGRTLLDQQHSIDRARQRISVLGQENSKLRGEIKRLQNPSQIEQIAHQEYGLVLPGQQAYTIIPPTATTTTTTVPEHR